MRRAGLAVLILQQAKGGTFAGNCNAIALSNPTSRVCYTSFTSRGALQEHSDEQKLEVPKDNKKDALYFACGTCRVTHTFVAFCSYTLTET